MSEELKVSLHNDIAGTKLFLEVFIAHSILNNPSTRSILKQTESYLVNLFIEVVNRESPATLDLMQTVATSTGIIEDILKHLPEEPAPIRTASS